MKKLSLLLACVFIYGITSYSQSNEFKSITISAGGGLGIYKTNSEFTATYFNGSVTITDKDTSGAVTSYAYIGGDYGISELISVGIYFQKGRYLQEKDSGKIKDNSFYKIDIMPKLYIINKDKFNLYAGLGIGIQGFKNSEDNGITKSESKYSGLNIHVRLGMNYYFTKSIGLFVHAGYDRSNMKLNELTYTTGSTTNTASNLSGKLITSGAEIAAGLNFKF